MKKFWALMAVLCVSCSEDEESKGGTSSTSTESSTSVGSSSLCEQTAVDFGVIDSDYITPRFLCYKEEKWIHSSFDGVVGNDIYAFLKDQKLNIISHNSLTAGVQGQWQYYEGTVAKAQPVSSNIYEVISYKNELYGIDYAGAVSGLIYQITQKKEIKPASYQRYRSGRFFKEKLYAIEAGLDQNYGGQEAFISIISNNEITNEKVALTGCKNIIAGMLGGVEWNSQNSKVLLSCNPSGENEWAKVILVDLETKQIEKEFISEKVTKNDKGYPLYSHIGRGFSLDGTKVYLEKSAYGENVPGGTAKPGAWYDLTGKEVEKVTAYAGEFIQTSLGMVFSCYVENGKCKANTLAVVKDDGKVEPLSVELKHGFAGFIKPIVVQQ